MKKWVLYLLLEENRAIAFGSALRAIACYTKSLEFRNGKCFRRVTEEGYKDKMLENYKLPNKLRRAVEKELENSEIIQWIEQPIPRLFTRSVFVTCLSLLVPIAFFSFGGLTMYNQARDMGITLFEFTQGIGLIILLLGTVIPVILIFFIPISNWLEVCKTVYIITNKRAFILVSGRTTKVTSFIPPELRVISRKQHKDGSGDVIVYIHHWKDYDGDLHTQEMGFKQVRNPKALEKILLQLNSS